MIGRLIALILCSLITGAHFLRADQVGLMALSLLVPFLLLYRRQWVGFAISGLLIGASGEWLRTIIILVNERLSEERPYWRMVGILAAVILVHWLTAFLFFGKRVRQWLKENAETSRLSAFAFLLTFALLSVVVLMVKRPMLLADRFLPGSGMLSVLGLSIYAAWIAERLWDRKKIAKWRTWLWTLFSISFFGQLLLGGLGIDRFLMTGALHAPVPALMVAGPIFRGEGFFMPILFLTTLVVVGPAWCSHLCYIGAWDNAFAKHLNRAKRAPKWRRLMQGGMLALTIMVAMTLRYMGVSGLVASLVGLGFGLIGVGIMALWSRKTGLMMHCIAYCPIGFLATTLGKISPFRIGVRPGCDACGACGIVCRYGALEPQDLKSGHAGAACTLCGDCLGACKGSLLQYRYWAMESEGARDVFIVLVSALHAVFLGVARI